ncbi:MalY/PatB family protein [Anaeromicropila herbilytica]|uniref:cysteine-S-conjugate beta-lyase n=1 Tax=Anaeromicropila herbilytica TaxID=2785025 RepID=A0A7R7IDL8_9FIRM|nr:MalY/PatB family protein [Anaeromicropila herbilytica]BCN31101.1 cystathionine beta-lyase [Anaeromicropila herbilytica]
MKFDFDNLVDRRNTNSLKWDVAEHELPMWVADMDFQTAPAVIQALEHRVQTGIFGYSVVTDAWTESIRQWWSRRHRFQIEKDWIIFCTGVVPAITCAVKRLTNVGDNILVQTPVYDIFFHSIENHGRHVLENKLSYDGEKYEIDFEDLEEKLSHPLTTMMILCNPHNPIGKIWSKEELFKIGELCAKHHVVVISDEIHCDLADPGYEYIPFASVSEKCSDNSVTCIAASKAFNLAGLQSAAVIIPNEALRQKMDRGLNSDEIAEPNIFAVDAMVAAFTEGEEWLDDLLAYLENNKRTVEEFLKKEIPNVKLVSSHATYLLWLDCSEILGDATELCHFIRKETGLYLSEGSKYRGNGHRFIRMNIACQAKRLEDGLQRLKKGVKAYEKWVVEQC